MIEEWMDVIGTNGMYRVSDQGNIYSLYRRRIIKGSYDKNGYLSVALAIDKKVKYMRLHRVVAMAFIPNPYGLPCVNHINEVKDDNRATNLEWITHKDNDNHGTRNERMSQTKKVNPVLQYDRAGNFIREWAGVKDVHLAIGVNRNSIRECCRGNQTHAGGYIWRFKGEVS